jgi:hypothetical protein
MTAIAAASCALIAAAVPAGRQHRGCEHIQKLVECIYRTPKDVVERARASSE